MKPYHLNGTLPEAIENLIMQFCYPVNSVFQMNMCAYSSFDNATQLNVPFPWKRLLTKQGFHWRNYLLTNLNPFSPVTQINIAAVRETVRHLCWGYLKYQPCIACNIARDMTKSEVLKILHFWTPCSCEVVYKIQRLLCSVDLHRATINNRGCLCHVFLPNETPLSLHLNAIR